MMRIFAPQLMRSHIMPTVKLISVVIVAAAMLLLIAQGAVAQQAATHESVLQFDPAKSVANITLTGNFHTVEGSFHLKRGLLRYDATSGAVSGEIVFDATSGKTDNDSRDRKMHKDVLESARFPEISFRASHAEGTLAASADSTVQVHGFFSIHGVEHEVTFPVQMKVEGDHWTATSSFTVPYVKWGLKNPSVLFLRVADEVNVELHAVGTLGIHNR